jgi:hypothetical protein
MLMCIKKHIKSRISVLSAVQLAQYALGKTDWLIAARFFIKKKGIFCLALYGGLHRLGKTLRLPQESAALLSVKMRVAAQGPERKSCPP